MLCTPIDGDCAAAADNNGAAGDDALRLFPPGKGHSRGGGEQRWSRASAGGGGESDGGKNRATDYDAAYFQSYAHLGIHEEMIKDSVRTDTYRAAIFHYQQYIAGKVYAMDASDIAVQANEVVKANNLSDKVIVLDGRVEDVEIDEKVDVIISEWMGYMLLYESMLGSVVTARDRWLKPGGLILPSHATLLMAPITHPDRYSQSIDFWNEVYGINMSAMIPLAKQCAFEEPSVELINGENVMTWAEVIKHVDCYTVKMDELESVTAKFNFKSMMRAPFNGFAFWFNVEFGGPAELLGKDNTPLLDHKVYENGRLAKKHMNGNKPLFLSTDPEDPPTHWQQTVLYLYEPIDLGQDQVIQGSVTLSQSKENRRFMNIRIQYATGGRSFVKESVMR